MLTKEKTWKILIVLSLIGIALASYLFYNFLAKPVNELCYINDRVNCEAVTKGALATIFGVPVSLIGLAGYLIIFLSSLLKYQKLLLEMSAFGLVFCLSIISQELFIYKVVCPVCLSCLVVMFTVFLLGLKLNFGFKEAVKNA